MNTTLRWALGLAALLLALAPQWGYSQATLSVQPGDRVRVTVHPGRATGQFDGRVFRNSGEPIVAEWEGNSDGTILLRDKSGIVNWQIPQESVERVEVSLGHERRMGQSVFKWTLGMAVGFGILGAVAWDPCTETGFMACFLAPTSRSESFAWGAMGGAIVGIPVGFLAGLRKHEIWSDNSIQNLRASVQAAPGGRVGVGLNLPVGGRYSP